MMAFLPEWRADKPNTYWRERCIDTHAPVGSLESPFIQHALMCSNDVSPLDFDADASCDRRQCPSVVKLVMC